MKLQTGFRWVAVACLASSFVVVGTLPARADEVDDLIALRMRERNIVGVSIAIIDGGKIVKAQGYGFTDKSGKTPVTPATLFQAGSISKPVAAMGALRLVQDGRFALDDDVNAHLKTWRVPDNDFTKQSKVTPRRILCHTAGLTVHGFAGYRADGTIPTVVQILDGAEPANTTAVRVDVEPGSIWRYSGGGYTVMQLMMADVTGKPFPRWMDEAVLTPLGMTDSSYDQPLPATWAEKTASGHDGKGNAVKGRWHVYPEQAAAGLWTTPSDLAKFAISVQRSLAGHEHPVLSGTMIRLMIIPVKNGDGLGFFTHGKDKTLCFGHGGRDEGFDAQLTAYAHVGKGAAIMLNANENHGVVVDIINAIAKQYGWSEGIKPPSK